ncbi:MAG: C4-dicarboxylate ABC transporter permease [Burkholderiales bacterium 70-64]|nr:MAG: C4-dicarboxylate ABC transporter permease [Burkholderiales bacterium 70-64]
MSLPLIGALGFAIVILLCLLRLPVAIAMGVVGFAGLGLTSGFDTSGFMLGRATFEAVFPYSLSIVPLFIAMGVFAGHAGLSQSLYAFVAALVGHLRGGLAMATVGGCAIFGAVSGSGIATTATMGRVALPEMRRHGYADTLATASVAAGGTLGVMIPPSILFVIYGLATEQSIGKLFLAGVLPGILGMFLYSLAVAWSVRRRADAGPAGERRNWAERLAALRAVWQVALLFGVVLGGLYLGWFSPTEAAAVGAFGAMLLAALSGRLTRRALANGVAETALTSGMIFMILIGAGIFNAFVESTGMTDAMIEFVRELGWSRWAVMAVLMITYVILGALMDELSMILLTVGPVFQLITALGFDPIWFGVMLVTVCEIGMILPPVGINLFVIQAIAGVPLATVVRGIAPFAVVDGLRLVLLSVFPWLALWLPSRMI